MNIFHGNRPNCYTNNYKNCSNSCSNNCKNNLNNCCCNSCNKVPFNFSQKKENTLCSLREVECFLCNCQKALKCFKFYCFFK